MKFPHSDKPWITPSIKMLVKERQKAFYSQNTPLWKSLRNKVQQTIAECKRSFYQTKVQDLKKDNCRKWRGIVNKMSGRSERSRHLLLERDGKTLSDPELANALNNFFTSVSLDIPPLDLSLLPASPPPPHGRYVAHGTTL